jgi:TP53 regulating kinase and related kinases
MGPFAKMRRLAGWLAIEWIEGRTIRACLDDFLRQLEDEGAKFEDNAELLDLMSKVGQLVGRLHEIGIIHGDLTTSNLMLRNDKQREGVATSLEGDVVLIDFGLANQSIQDEDQAVDLYVLERAFGSTHPQAEGLFQEVLKAYGKSYRKGKMVLKRLEDVRLRGRKKSMIG